MHKAIGKLALSCVLFASVLHASEPEIIPVETSLESLELWLQSNAAPLSDLFNPPATAGDFDLLEAQYGVMLPHSVKAAYWVHDGEKKSSDGIFGTWRWLPLKEVIQQRKALEADRRGFDANMIPVLVSGGGDLLYVESVDAASAESEVIEWWHEDPTRDVKYANFAVMLQDFVESLENGQYVYLPDDILGLVDKSDL